MPEIISTSEVESPKQTPEVSEAPPKQENGIGKPIPRSAPKTVAPKEKKPVASQNGTAKSPKKAPVAKPKAAAKPSKPAAKPKINRAVKSAKSQNKCLCGCGGLTGSRFVPGHDARLKSQFQTKYREGKLAADEKKLVDQLGWMRFLDKDKAKEVKELAGRGLSTPHTNILRILSKKPNGLTRTEINKELGVGISLQVYLGPVFKDDIAKVEKESGKKSLLGLKYVTTAGDERNGKDVVLYKLTVAGEKAFAAAVAKTKPGS